eukprot:7255-Eustigmatos_ZCMA.PRE.1
MHLKVERRSLVVVIGEVGCLRVTMPIRGTGGSLYCLLTSFRGVCLPPWMVRLVLPRVHCCWRCSARSDSSRPGTRAASTVL